MYYSARDAARSASPLTSAEYRKAAREKNEATARMIARHEYTYSSVRDRLSVSPSTFSEWKNGGRYPNVTNALALANIFDKDTKLGGKYLTQALGGSEGLVVVGSRVKEPLPYRNALAAAFRVPDKKTLKRIFEVMPRRMRSYRQPRETSGLHIINEVFDMIASESPEAAATFLAALTGRTVEVLEDRAIAS